MKTLLTTLCLTIAVLLGSIGNSESADFQNGLTAAQSGDFATALREFTPLAEQGNAGAQSSLGFMYEKGQGVPQDYKTAVKWYTLAAKQGYAGAQFGLGHMYKEGRGVPRDYVRAHMWFNIAASSGESEDASKNRDIVAGVMTPSQIEKAQDLARECVRKNYKGGLIGDSRFWEASMIYKYCLLSLEILTDMQN